MSASRLAQMVQRRVVVTGLGLLTPLGLTLESSWNSLCSGQSGVRELNETHHPDFAKLERCVGAKVIDGFKKDHWMLMVRFTKNLVNAYAMAVSVEALASSGWIPESEEQSTRTGVILGTGLGSVNCALEHQERVHSKGFDNMDRLSILKTLGSLAAGSITTQFHLKGPTNTVSTACASGQTAIGEAMRTIQRGDADVMIAVGAEHAVLPFVIAGFSKIGALSKVSTYPEAASRPFDEGRSGFVVGEGAGALVLEDAGHAKKRGARIFAELRGYGCNSEGEHLTRPRSDGFGAYHSMLAALKESGLSPEHIDLINAHATSTQDGDLAEATAINRLFDKLQPVITANKGNVGHMMGAAGAVESVFTVMSVNTGVIPPILNLEKPLAVPLNFARSMLRKPVDAALSNSFGFGGVNTTLVFTKYSEDSA